MDFFFLTISLWWHPWSVAIFFLPIVHCWTCLCTYAVMCVILPSFRPFLNIGQSDFAGLCQEENLKVSRSPVASTFVKEWSLVQKEEQRLKLVLGWRCLRTFKELSDGRKLDSLGWTSAWTLFSWCLEGTRPCWSCWGCFSAARTEQSGSETALKAEEVFICVIILRAIIKENVEKKSGNFHRLYFMFRVTQQFWWHRGTLRSPQHWHTFCKQVQDASYMIN